MHAPVPHGRREQDEENEAIARVEEEREGANRAGQRGPPHRRGEAQSVRRRDRRGAERVRINVGREKHQRREECGHRPYPAPKPRAHDRVAEDECGHRRRPRRRSRDDDLRAESAGDDPAW